MEKVTVEVTKLRAKAQGAGLLGYWRSASASRSSPSPAGSWGPWLGWTRSRRP